MRLFTVFLLFISISGYTQCKTYTLSANGDTLNCTDIKGLKQGPWVNHVDEVRGEPGFEEEGVYLNGQKEGLWRTYSLQGDLMARENYKWGIKHGQCIYYTRIGELLREEYWRATDPAQLYDTVPLFDLNDPTKIIDYVIVKNEGHAMKHGSWKYFDPQYGTIVKTEDWFLDKPKKKEDDLAPIDVSDPNAKKAEVKKPQAIIDYEKKNSGKKKMKVRDGRTGG
jgi:hypothetical protein